jgi:hypothetical protein
MFIGSHLGVLSGEGEVNNKHILKDYQKWEYDTKCLLTFFWTD